MWSRLSALINEGGRDVQRGLDGLGQQLQSEWNDVSVQCPNCTKLLKVPESVNVFKCSSCGSNINKPKLENKLSYHGARYANKFIASLSDALGQKQELQVIVPEGSRGGDTIQVPAGAGGALLHVLVPQGLESGQSFRMQAPASAAQQKPVHAITSAAPDEPPVAMPLSTTPLEDERSQQRAAPVEPSREGGHLATRFESALRGFEMAWKNVAVKCPSCSIMLQAPQGVELFTCGRCGASIKSPDLSSKMELHLNRLGSKIGGAIGDALGQTIPIQVTVPPGVREGESCQIQTDQMKTAIKVVIPEGVESGQTFIYQAPMSVFETSYVARTEEAPATVPVAAAAPSEPPQANRASSQRSTWHVSTQPDAPENSIPAPSDPQRRQTTT